MKNCESFQVTNSSFYNIKELFDNACRLYHFIIEVDYFI